MSGGTSSQPATTNLDVAKLIASNLEFYDTIKPKKALESPFYTVIATLNDVKTQELLALATGTQASLKVYDNDIEDCHAESLLKRAYKRQVLDQLLSVISDKDSKRAIRTLLKLKIDELDRRELVMFVSQFPCGLIKRFAGEEPTNEDTGQVIMRKPGRGVLRDGKCVYVQRDNCISKIKRWLASHGFEGQRLRETLGVRGSLQRLVVGDCEPDPDLEYQPILDRLGEFLSSPDPLTIGLQRMRRDEFVCDKRTQARQPLPVATIWWAGGPSGAPEYVVDGRRLGLTKGQSESARPGYMLRTSDYWLRADLDRVASALS